LNEAGELWSDDARSRERWSPLFAQVRQGVPLSDVLAGRKIFPAYMVAMIRIGEATGTLPLAFTKCADYLAARHGFRQSLVAALVYPAIVLAVAAVALVILFLHVLPIFEEMYRRFDTELPLLTRALIAAMNFLRANVLWLVLVGVIISLLFRHAYRNDSRRLNLDHRLLHLPFLGGFMRQYYQMVLCSGLGHLLAAGIGLLEALDILVPIVPNRWLQRCVSAARQEVAKGRSLAESFRQHKVLALRSIKLVHIAEQSADLAGTLSDLAVMLEETVTHQLKRFTSAFEPLLIVLMALVIGVVLVALYLPMFDIVSVME
jgi:type IV pilus assembly protein PilC